MGNSTNRCISNVMLKLYYRVRYMIVDESQKDDMKITQEMGRITELEYSRKGTADCVW